MKFLGVFVLLFFSLTFAQTPPNPPGGPYDYSLDLSSNLGTYGGGSLSQYFGANAYYTVYWSVTTTHVIFGAVCRIWYPEGSVTIPAQPAQSNFCGFGFTTNPGFMLPLNPEATSDAIVGYTPDYATVIVDDFRLGGKRADNASCYEDADFIGSCLDPEFVFNEGPSCEDNVLLPYGEVYNISDTEIYLAFNFSRLLNTSDRATCDQVITLDVPINPIFSIGFAQKTEYPWPYNIGANGYGEFVHAARGPTNSSLTITFSIPNQVTTEQSSTQGYTTALQTTSLLIVTTFNDSMINLASFVSLDKLLLFVILLGTFLY